MLSSVIFHSTNPDTVSSLFEAAEHSRHQRITSTRVSFVGDDNWSGRNNIATHLVGKRLDTNPTADSSTFRESCRQVYHRPAAEHHHGGTSRQQSSPHADGQVRLISRGLPKTNAGHRLQQGRRTCQRPDLSRRPIDQKRVTIEDFYSRNSSKAHREVCMRTMRRRQYE